ncbi:MFS transporter [Paraburkholderia sp. SEWSISQ10-3 4]|uniref:MFS transporter n=1 Tax=Paraburkholderia TaxID=1822464 RepID=UPI002257BD5C|nr:MULTISPECIES: MFS transporter [Paraburkholderia]MCX4142414.1 MFS transporter [Paraburkholderia aspalathi]MDN7175094.1 MFS transporter [Paraburkholderia sp. SEWSISQ10-3 4]MDQ6504735.1 MFS transporter [Paraburkholderia aspalathi]
MNDEREYQKRVLIATSLSYVIVILDTSIVNVALEPVAASLGSDIAGLQWVVNAYTLTFASLLLSGGALGDRIGAKTVYLAGLLVFACASALCGLAPDLQILVVARVLQGIGAALLVPCSLTLINHAFPVARQRASAIGVLAGCGGIAMAAGPLAGGLLTHLLGWRSIFLVNVPIALIGAWLTTRVASVRPPSSDRSMDVAGQLLAVVALGASVAVLIEGAKLGWQAAAIRAGAVIALAAWVAFVLVEGRRKQPMLPLGFFRSPVFSASAFVSLISGLIFYGLFFLLSLYFQSARGWSPLQTGLAFLPLTVMVAIGSFASGALNRTYGAHRLVCAGFLLYAVGFVGLVALADDAPYWRIALCFPAVGFAAGVISPAATAALMTAVDKARAGVGAGVLNASRQTGAAFGVAIFGALMSAIQPADVGIRTAVYLAIGLSLLGALVWSVALAVAARYAGSDAW